MSPIASFNLFRLKLDTPLELVNAIIALTIPIPSKLYKPESLYALLSTKLSKKLLLPFTGSPVSFTNKPAIIDSSKILRIALVKALLSLVPGLLLSTLTASDAAVPLASTPASNLKVLSTKSWNILGPALLFTLLKSVTATWNSLNKLASVATLESLISVSLADALLVIISDILENSYVLPTNSNNFFNSLYNSVVVPLVLPTKFKNCSAVIGDIFVSLKRLIISSMYLVATPSVTTNPSSAKAYCLIIV